MPIKKFRIKQALTQVQIASMIGISVISYQRIEYGKQKPSLKTAIKIARVLNSTVEELWGKGVINES